MAFEADPVHDPTDNPYLPKRFHDMSPALDTNPTDIEYATAPEFTPQVTHDPNGGLLTHPGALWHGNGHGLAAEAGDEDEDETGSNSSDSLVEIEPHEFPGYFSERGVPARLFHSHGMYCFPVDSDEMKRQQALHVLLRQVIGSNYGDAPVQGVLNHGSKVVDLCTGVGHWVLDMAAEFPFVEFRGIDLVPIQTREPPGNVRFEIADATQELRFANGSVDIVHARMTSLRGETLPYVINEIARILRPGGLFISAEWGSYAALHPQHPRFGEHGAYIPGAHNFYEQSSHVVARAQDIPGFIHANGAFDEPVSQLRALPVSRTHYVPGMHQASSRQDEALFFVSQVMGRIAKGYARALVAGDVIQQGVADAFIGELQRKVGIVSVYHSVYARKRG
ncbi:hypothetical protein BC834DRAFT_890257 [Gloeopeniophorella convolvens]|nr:hypothetical protein BC834DRAFT_890257 [Gloeopeniophorella convolvens]